MASRVSAAAMEGIHSLYHWGAMGNWSDEQLIAQFVTGQDGSEAAFRVLIHRHGPMVLGICRRVLGDEHAAEDAFQTTFLVLVKKARGLRDCKLLTNWLHGVALKVANKDRAKGARRRAVERQATGPSVRSEGGADQAELRFVIDEEIHRLPERYRVALVLCHVEGLRHDEVAYRLGCPVGTVESRLSRAREQLRARLARRGLAPSASAMGAMLRPPGGSALASSLVASTLRSAVELSGHQAIAGTGTATAWAWAKRTCGLIPKFNPGAVASTLIVCAGFGVMGLTVFRAEGEPATPVVAEPPPAPTTAKQPKAAALKFGEKQIVAATPRPTPEQAKKQNDAVKTNRSPLATAPPLAGITIDGQLNDWPKNSRKYAIDKQLHDHPSYNSNKIEADDDSRAYFMAGYDSKTEQIYLAVVVRDNDVVVHPSDLLRTDSVEIYIDGNFSDKAIWQPGENSHDSLNAATMPVLQYVGVPGKVSAYGDRWAANPSLLYAQTKQTATKMKYHRDGDLITYEWSVKAFDRFPARPTRLYPGKRLGLDVAVVDKDNRTTTGKNPPTFLTWGSPPVVFKGCDAGSLGELILTDRPAP